MIDRLQALGFVERRPCHDSRREVLLRVTRPGREHLAHVRERRDQVLLQALASMPGHQRAALAEGLAGLQQALTSHPMLRAVAEDTTPITERTAQSIVNDLEQACHLRRERNGRRTHYSLCFEGTLRHPADAHVPVRELLELFTAHTSEPRV